MSDEHITYRGRRAIVTASIVGTLAFVGGIGKMCYDIIIPMPNRTVANQIRQVNILSSNISYLKTQMYKISTAKPSHHDTLDTRLSYYPISTQDSLERFYASNVQWKEFFSKNIKILEENKTKIESDSAYKSVTEKDLRDVKYAGLLAIIGMIAGMVSMTYNDTKVKAIKKQRNAESNPVTS